ncbi:MAG: hypothetical protein LBP21_00050 [Synergistaceae bacterium]|jgi:hypothetical protein|nr:hypothetical protein [Synergistaceae bacterium]
MYEEIRKLPNDVLDAKIWLALRDPSERRMMCMFFTPPEYTKNFNELYEAEKALSPEQYSQYVKLLLGFASPLPTDLEETLGENPDPPVSIGCAIALRATARQRAEALATVLRGDGSKKSTQTPS